MDNSQIVEIFPTPVFITKLPEHLSSILPWFYQQEVLVDEVDYQNYGERSKNSYILNEPETHDLSSFLLRTLTNFGKTIGYAYDEYKFTQSWLSFKQPNQHHNGHSHPNSLISGVLYFGEMDQSTPGIEFQKMVGGVNVSYISPYKVKNYQSNRYSQDKFSINVEPGMVILFPSGLHHSVPVNNTNKVRCSLAFNSVPKTSLGEEITLTEFKYN